MEIQLFLAIFMILGILIAGTIAFLDSK